MAAQPARGIGSSLKRLLVEPHASIIDPVERRRGRLLATLLLTQIAECMLSFVTIRAEEGAVGERGPYALIPIVALMVVAYLLVRGRKPEAALPLYVASNLIPTITFILVVGPTPDLSPLMSIAFLTLPIIMVNTFASARATLLTGVIGIASSVTALLVLGPASWHSQIRQGCTFISFILILVIVLGVHRDRVEADRSAELRARNDELEALRRTLEQRVEERTAALSARNREMRVILDNAAQGLFTIDRSGALTSETSAALLRWFGEPEGREPFFRYFGRSDARFGPKAEIGWEQVVEGFLPLEMAMDQMPSTLSAGGRIFRLSFEPIGVEGASASDVDGAPQSFLVVVSDVTAEVEREKMALERRETFALFEHMSKNRSAVVDFFENASQLVDRILAPHPERVAFARDVHTLKGDALTFGLEGVGRYCHDLETLMLESSELPNASGLGEIWARVAGDIDRMLGDKRRTIEVSREQQETLERAVRGRVPHEQILPMVVAMKLEDVEPRLLRLADNARQIAERLGKQIDVKVSTSGACVAGGKWSPLWSALIHAVRNAVDHGLESPDEREHAGKSASGHLWLRAIADEHGSIAIEVEDDGRGIDWDAIRKRATMANVASDGDANLHAALFADGISTAAEVTDISGRGVGMGALRASVHDLGGHLLIESARTRGTTLRIVLPEAAPAQMELVA